MAGGYTRPRDTGTAHPAGRGWLVRIRVLLTALTIVYAAAVVGLCLVLYLASDRWWAATLLLYGPRWPWAVPLAVLLPAAGLLRRRLLWLLGPVLPLLLFGLLGLCLPWASLSGNRPRGMALRVLSCNIHHSELDPVALGTVLAVAEPDIVLLQAWSSSHERAVFAYGDWHITRAGQHCLASRYPIRRVECLDDPDFTGGDYAIARCEVDAPGRSLMVVSLHLASPRDGLEEFRGEGWQGVATLEANSDLRRRQSEKAVRWLDSAGDPLLIAGDFNTPPESTTYSQFWGHYTNAFSSAGFGFGPTFFTRRASVRIDHILMGPGWRCRRCWVGPPVGSPHRPVIADLYYERGEE